MTGWSIFPALLSVLITLGLYWVSGNFGSTAVYVVSVVLIAVLPASLAVLAISQSPFESLNPLAIGEVIKRCGGEYWIAPTFMIVSGVIVVFIDRVIPWQFARGFITFYLLFALFALMGGIIRSEDLIQEADIPDALEPEQSVQDAALEKERTEVLNHAYGFISRNNRAGGFRHIESWLQRDPDPETAWAWFFEQMMRWEIKMPALLFAQSYVSELLKAGEDVTAVKVMLRCRMENPDFVPLPEDIGAAIEAAERRQNHELAAFLRSRV